MSVAAQLGRLSKGAGGRRKEAEEKWAEGDKDEQLLKLQLQWMLGMLGNFDSLHTHAAISLSPYPFLSSFIKTQLKRVHNK